jgi:peptidoglycan/LPS O-acetylase OafA/YrhL
MHAAIAAVLSAPIVFFGRKRVRWHAWELLLLILPFTVWAVLMFSDYSTGTKTLANLGEPFFFALGVPIAALVRVALGSRVREPVCAASAIAALCLAAAAVFFTVPPLPE